MEELDILYQQLQPLIRRLLQTYGGAPEARQDLQGEIYLHFRQLLAAYDPNRGIPLRAYLIHQLRFTTYTHVRSQWRHRKREISYEEWTDNDPLRLREMTNPWEDCTEELHREQVQACLPQAIAQLSHRQQHIVRRWFFESRSYAELAEELDITEATVRSLMRHALNNLRRQLAQQGWMDSR